MTLAANERMGTLAGGATVTKAFCFDCLTLLESDGETVTVTRLVRAVTPGEVAAVRELPEKWRRLAVEYKGKAEKALKAVGAYTGYVARMGEAATSRLECAAELAAALAAVSKQPEVTP